MTTNPERRGSDDMGGDLDHRWAGPVPRAERILAPWEKEVDAICTTLRRKGMSAEERLLGIECPAGKGHAGLYHERSLRSILDTTERNAILTRDRLAAELGRAAGVAGMKPRFRRGEGVGVTGERLAIAFARPHFRQPHHARRRHGIVTAELGRFGNPEGRATGGDGLPMLVPSCVRLYPAERFCQAELRRGRAGAACVELRNDSTRDCMIGTAVPAA